MKTFTKTRGASAAALLFISGMHLCLSAPPITFDGLNPDAAIEISLTSVSRFDKGSYYVTAEIFHRRNSMQPLWNRALNLDKNRAQISRGELLALIKKKDGRQMASMPEDTALLYRPYILLSLKKTGKKQAVDTLRIYLSNKNEKLLSKKGRVAFLDELGDLGSKGGNVELGKPIQGAQASVHLKLDQ